jgi:hypothetical protein
MENVPEITFCTYFIKSCPSNYLRNYIKHVLELPEMGSYFLLGLKTKNGMEQPRIMQLITGLIAMRFHYLGIVTWHRCRRCTGALGCYSRLSGQERPCEDAVPVTSYRIIHKNRQ